MGSVCTGVVVFHRSVVDWRMGWVVSVCTGVDVFHRSMVDCRRG